MRVTPEAEGLEPRLAKERGDKEKSKLLASKTDDLCTRLHAPNSGGGGSSQALLCSSKEGPKRKGSNTGTGSSSRPMPITGDAEFVQAKLREKKEDSTCSSPNANSVNPQVPPYIGKLRPG